MASIIKLKRSSTASSVPSGLAVGEIAVNLKDRILYVGNTTGSVAMSGTLATTTDTGVASFSSGDFAVSGVGAVTIKTGGIDNGQLAADAVDGTKIANAAVDSEHIAATSIDAGHISTGAVTSAKILDKTIVAGDIKDGTITSTQLAAGAIVANTIADNSIALGTKTTGNYVSTATGSGDVLITGSGSETSTITVSLKDNISANTTGSAATLTTARTIGGVSFNGSANITLPGVNASGNQDTSGLAATATALATGRTISTTGDVAFTSGSFDGSGNVTGVATIQPNSVDLTTMTTGNYASAVTGTANEVEVTGSAGEGTAFQVGLPSDVTIGNNLTVTGAASVAGNVTIDGNLTVEGATTYISSSTVNVDDSAIKLSANNSADTVDIGMYGKYVVGATTKYSGWHRDASASGTIVFYKDTQVEPTTTVDIGATGYTLAQVDAVIDGGSY